MSFLEELSARARPSKPGRATVCFNMGPNPLSFRPFGWGNGQQRYASVQIKDQADKRPLHLESARFPGDLFLFHHTSPLSVHDSSGYSTQFPHPEAMATPSALQLTAVSLCSPRACDHSVSSIVDLGHRDGFLVAASGQNR